MSAADSRSSAGWLEFLKVVVAPLITGVVAYLVARIQSEASVEVARAEAERAKEATVTTEKKLQQSDQRIDASEEKIRELVMKLNDFKRLREVSATFRKPKANSTVDESTKCEGHFE